MSTTSVSSSTTPTTSAIPAAVTAATETAKKLRFVSYTVKAGDTLSGIAAKTGTSLARLAKLNPQVKNLDLIYPGQKIRVRVVKASNTQPAPQPAPPPQQQAGGKTVLPKGMPNTTNMSDAQEYALYSKYVEKFGDAKAKADLKAGKRVIVGLRNNTPFTSDRPYRGTYDDRLVVMWKDSAGKPHVEEFLANTEPNRRWADDPAQASKPVGRLVGNKTYHYRKSYKSAFGGNILSPNLAYGNPTVRRDTNRDHRIDAKDGVFNGDWGGQGFYFHRGGYGDTYSAGCQTMDQGRFNSFWAALGSQSDFSYVLANVG